MRTGDETSYGCHRLCKGTYVEIDLVHHSEMLRSSASVLSEEAETVSIIYHYAEIVFLLESADLVEFAECAGHSIYAFGDEQHSAALFVSLGAGPCEHLLAVFDVVVAIFVFAAHVQTYAVHKAGVALCVIYDDVVTGGQSVYGREYALITEVEQECVLLLLEVGEDFFEFLVIAGVTGHHSGTHRIGKTPIGCTLRISFADLRMVCESKIVVETPVEHLLAVEDHVRTEFSLETRIHVIAESLLEVLADRAAGIFRDSVENV